MDKPTKCLLTQTPTPTSISIAGVYISLGLLARQGFDKGHLSRLFSGQRSPSIKTLQRLSEALGMPTGSLLADIVSRGSLND